MKPLLISLFIGVLTKLLINFANQKPKYINSDTFELRRNIGVSFIGFFSFILGISILIYGIYSIIVNPKNMAILWIFILLFLFFSGLSIPLILATLFYKVIVSNEKIYQRSNLGKWKTLKWVEIKSIEYDYTNHQLVFKGRGVRVIVSRYLRGFPVFLEFVKKQTTHTIRNEDLIDK